jgi:hypothetical protein
MRLIILVVMMCFSSCSLTPKIMMWDQLRSPCQNDNGGIGTTSVSSNLEFCRPGHGVIIGASRKI